MEEIRKELDQQEMEQAAGGKVRRGNRTYYDCMKCGRLFRSQEELRAHVRAVHLKDTPPAQHQQTEPPASDSPDTQSEGGATGSW